MSALGAGSIRALGRLVLTIDGFRNTARTPRKFMSKKNPKMVAASRIPVLARSAPLLEVRIAIWSSVLRWPGTVRRTDKWVRRTDEYILTPNNQFRAKNFSAIADFKKSELGRSMKQGGASDKS
jgi:hypothetical protein